MGNWAACRLRAFKGRVHAVNEIPAADDVPNVGEVVPLSDVAGRLGLSESRVHQMLRDGQLLAIRHSGVLVVPADLLTTDGVVKGVAGTVTVLRDGGYSDEEILRWLFTEDDTLPGTPVAALRADRGKEVKRRAQAMAF
jgi:Rv2175c C-terminal domain of unknown function